MRTVAVAVLSGLITLAPAGAGTARFRVLHAVPGQPPMRVYLDGDLVGEPVAYGTLGAWSTARAGNHNFKAVPADGAQFADDRDSVLEAGLDYTIALVPSGQESRFLRLVERVPEGLARGHVRVVHLAAGVPPVEILPAGDPPLAALAFGQVMLPAPVPTGDCRFELRDAKSHQRVALVGPVAVADRTTLTLYLIGRAGRTGDELVRVVEDVQPWPSPPAAPVEPPAPVSAPPPPPTRLRLLHLAPGVTSVGGRLNDRPLVTDLRYGQVTEYLPVADGRHQLKVALAGQDALSLELDLATGEPYTVVVYDAAPNTNLWLLRDQSAAAGPARLRVVSSCLDLAQADLLVGDQALVSALGALTYSEYLPLPAGQPLRQLRLRATGESTVLRAAEVVFDPGTTYTLVVAGKLDRRNPEAGLSLRLLKDG